MKKIGLILAAVLLVGCAVRRNCTCLTPGDNGKIKAVKVLEKGGYYDIVVMPESTGGAVAKTINAKGCQWWFLASHVEEKGTKVGYVCDSRIILREIVSR